MTSSPSPFGNICNLQTGEVVRPANSVDWDYAREHGEPETGAFVDYETGAPVFCDGPAEMTAEMARAAFIERFETQADAMAFEEQVLGAGREFVPEDLRGEIGASEAYWAWLTDQHADWQHVLPNT